MSEMKIFSCPRRLGLRSSPTTSTSSGVSPITMVSDSESRFRTVLSESRANPWPSDACNAAAATPLDNAARFGGGMRSSGGGKGGDSTGAGPKTAHWAACSSTPGQGPAGRAEAGCRGDTGACWLGASGAGRHDGWSLSTSAAGCGTSGAVTTAGCDGSGWAGAGPTTVGDGRRPCLGAGTCPYFEAGCTARHGVFAHTCTRIGEPLCNAHADIPADRRQGAVGFHNHLTVKGWPSKSIRVKSSFHASKLSSVGAAATDDIAFGVYRDRGGRT